MACFLVPMVVAIVTTTVQKTSKSLAEKLKLSILNALLWGGVVLLAVEHVWHGEITPWAPYLTAMSSPADTAVMLSEMATIGTSMAAVITVTWLSTITIAHFMPKIVTIKDNLNPLSKPMTTPHKSH
ncbi:MAG: hypothetical protein WC325_01320 [Candidatus Bathyarchaeia archaeon]